MSGTTDDDDDVIANGHAHVNGGPISDADVRAMLLQEQQERRRLKAELDHERSSRTRAEASASTHQSARFEAEEQAVAARLGASDAEGQDLKRQFAEALAEGRFDESADLQDKMAELRAKQAQDRQYAAWLASEKARTKQEPAAAPVSQGVNLADYTPAQRKWIRANPEFMEDEKVRLKTFAGHQLAVADGIEIDSPEYFDLIDATVRGERGDPQDDAQPRQQRREAQEMPVTRRTPQTTQARQREVRLSADEREAADISMPDTPVEGHTDTNGQWVGGRYERYALQRQKLRAQGRG